MTYKDLLNKDDWTYKRYQILKRDNYTCQSCLNKKLISASTQCELVEITFYRPFIHFPSGGFYQEITYGILLNNESVGTFRSTVLTAIPLHQSCQTDNYKYFFSLVDGPNEEGLITKIPKLSIVQKTDIQERTTTVFARNIHIHHTYYQDSKLPWEYPSEALLTLCWQCHEELHASRKIPRLDEQGNLTQYLTPCHRCHGWGYLPQYSHVENGICFRCRGQRFEEFILGTS